MKIVLTVLLSLVFTIGAVYKGSADQVLTDGLLYDENDHFLTAGDALSADLVRIMLRECSGSADIKGSYILATDDRVLFAGGINAVDTFGNNVDAYTTYEIGSLTKAFTATAILQLCERGRLSLDDTLDRYFPGYEYSREITLRQLLHMRSGLRTDFVRDDTFLDENGDRDTDEFKRYYYDGFDDAELLSLLFSDPPQYRPGTRFLYSNAGYTLLAMIIEQVTGETYAQYIQKNIFDVCGMEHSSSMTTGDVTSIPEFVPGAPDEDPYELVDTLYMQLIKAMRGAGDIHSCAADILLFDRALMNGQLINETSLAEMLDTRSGYGCGWKQFGRYTDAWYHGGQTYFYMAYNLMCKTEKYGHLYLIQLHPTLAGDQYSNTCMEQIVRNVMQ
ncbi:MAG: serine hydrolase domain-containing protein [Clostridia bacterium]|nr:serine hydrolase domain-containing protein [Clostridia bacterium]